MQTNYTIIPRLRPDQREVAQHPARFKVVACGRRWGKTTLGLAMAFYLAQTQRRVWWVAPTYGLAFHPWRRLRAAFAGTTDLVAQKLEAERYIALEDGGEISVKTAHDPDLLRGVGLDFVVLDEAAYLDRRTWEAVLLPALADRQGRALIVSPPKGRNWFWEAFRRGQDPAMGQWPSWRAPTSVNYLMPPTEISSARELLPRRLFEQEYEAAFIADGGTVFRGVEAAADPDAAQPGPRAGHTYVMGVDFGRHEDFTALAVLDVTERALVALDRFTEVSWSLQRARIAALAARWGVRAILAEANAMGEPNIEALQRDGLPVSGFTTTGRSKPPLIESLALAIEDGELTLLPDPVLLG
ncbi:MAG: hypothetical protein ACFB51_12045 [Anaerolineae bacterium]